MIGLLREGVNNWVSEWIFERGNEWTSKSVGEWWNAWTIKWGSRCVKLWERMREWISVWGLGAFLRWWPPSTMWVGALIYFWTPPGCLNNPIFLNLGLCAACWARFMCHHKLWPTLVSHPFSSLNSSLGFTGGKYYQKITIPIFRLVPQNLLFQVTYILFYRYLFSLLSSGWFVIAICGSISVRDVVKH